jgi:hypothetical protein
MEIEMPFTCYECGSSSYDDRPHSFRQSASCEVREMQINAQHEADAVSEVVFGTDSSKRATCSAAASMLKAVLDNVDSDAKNLVNADDERLFKMLAVDEDRWPLFDYSADTGCARFAETRMLDRVIKRLARGACSRIVDEAVSISEHGTVRTEHVLTDSETHWNGVDFDLLHRLFCNQQLSVLLKPSGYFTSYVSVIKHMVPMWHRSLHWLTRSFGWMRENVIFTKEEGTVSGNVVFAQIQNLCKLGYEISFAGIEKLASDSVRDGRIPRITITFSRLAPIYESEPNRLRAETAMSELLISAGGVVGYACGKQEAERRGVPNLCSSKHVYDSVVTGTGSKRLNSETIGYVRIRAASTDVRVQLNTLQSLLLYRVARAVAIHDKERKGIRLGELLIERQTLMSKYEEAMACYRDHASSLLGASACSEVDSKKAETIKLDIAQAAQELAQFNRKHKELLDSVHTAGV